MSIFKKRIQSFLICLSFVACWLTWSISAFDGEPRPELIRNPSFDNGIENWNCYSSGTAQVIGERDMGDYDTAPASYRIQCMDKGDAANNIQLFTMPLNIVTDKVYLFTFRAKCTYRFSIPSIQLMKATSPWTLYALAYDGLTITNQWQTYAVLFKANTTAADGRITLFMGNTLPNGAIFNIDTLSLKEYPNGELLSDPGFDTGNSGWNFYCGGTAESYNYLDATDYDTAPVSYRIQCINSGSSMTDIQLFTMPINLEQNKKYQLTFKAKCTSSFVIPSIRLMKAISPMTLYDSPWTGLVVGNDWQSYSYTFTANTTAADGRLTFFLGNALPNGTTFKIDSISLKEKVLAIPSSTPTVTSVPTDTPTPTLTPTPTPTPSPTPMPFIYASTVGGLSISSNGGESFTNYTTANGLGDNYIADVYVLNGVIYAATWGGGLSISTNGGASFTSYTTANGLGSNAVYGVYVSGSIIYAATFGGGLSISSNGGASFTTYTTANGLGSNYTRCVYVSGSNIYVGTNSGLSISTNGGVSFRNYTNADGLRSNDVCGVYVSGGSIYAATWEGLSVSSNGGSSFTTYTIANGLGSNNLRNVYVSGSNIYVTTWGSGLSISTNGGPSFINYTTTNGLGHNLVYDVYEFNSSIYVSTEGGLSISTDGGASFTNYSTVNGLGDYRVYGICIR